MSALLPGIMFLFYVLPIIFVIWFMVTLVGQLKVQTKILEQINNKLNEER